MKFQPIIIILFISLLGSFQVNAAEEIISWEGTVNGEQLKITDKGVYRNGKFKKAQHLSKKDLCIFSNNDFPVARRASGSASKRYKKEWLNLIFQKQIEYVPDCYSLREKFFKKNKIKRSEIAAYISLKKTNLSKPASTETISPTLTLSEKLRNKADGYICALANFSPGKLNAEAQEAKRRGLSCGIVETSTTQTDTPKVVTEDSKFVFEVLDNYVENLINNLDLTKKPEKRYPGYSNIEQGRSKAFAACINWEESTNSLLKGEVVERFAFSVQYGSSDYKVKKSSLEKCDQNRRNLAKNCECELIALNENILLSDLLIHETSGKSFVPVFSDKVAGSSSKDNVISKSSPSSDNQIPLIEILEASSEGKRGKINGRVTDASGIAEVTIDGSVIQVQPDGRFEYQTFVPFNGINLRVVATDLSGLSSEKFIALERSANSQTASITFDRLNPLGKKVRRNENAIALVVGIANYENTPAKAIYADSDALMFKDYASEKLGIPENRIKTMVNDKADERELLLSVKSWLARSVRQDQTDVYIFFAGHGLASEDGEKMYLLPYDGAPELLDKTALLRKELFDDVASSGPRSVTVFFDTCYSGTTRGPDMLIASRPIAIRAKGSSIPDGFTVFTAAGGDQTAKPLEEAKHGMFSYFLMKGMEGDADSNQDNQITAAELHRYVEQNVVQQSGGSQVPELQGDAGRVLVRFQ